MSVSHLAQSLNASARLQSVWANVLAKQLKLQANVFAVRQKVQPIVFVEERSNLDPVSQIVLNVARLAVLKLHRSALLVEERVAALLEIVLRIWVSVF